MYLTSKIIKDCPNIGNVIEKFLKEHNVGADAWRRTGMLTFDGNANLQDKVTYKKIQSHLEKCSKGTFLMEVLLSSVLPETKEEGHRKGTVVLQK